MSISILSFEIFCSQIRLFQADCRLVGGGVRVPVTTGMKAVLMAATSMNQDYNGLFCTSFISPHALNATIAQLLSSRLLLYLIL